MFRTKLLPIVLALAALRASAARAQASVEDSIRALEEARGQALIRQDTVALSRMLAPEFTEISRLGTVRSRADNIRDIASGTLRLATVRYDSQAVKIYGDVAILTGIADNTGTFAGMPFTGRIRYTRVFVRRDGRWQAVLMQQTMTR